MNNFYYLFQRYSFIQHHFLEYKEFQMIIHPRNGNPRIAMVLVTLSTFKTLALAASFQSISLSFASEEAAKKFVEDVRVSGQSRIELNNVVFFPGFSGSQHAARAVYHAVNSYKDRLTSVNKFEINAFSEEDKNLLQDIKQYIKEHFGSDAMTVN